MEVIRLNDSPGRCDNYPGQAPEKPERQSVMKHAESTRNRSQSNRPLRLTVPTALLLLGTLAAGAQGTDNRAPSVPTVLEVPDGNKVHFHAYAVGVQIYTWNATLSKWVFKAPRATLYDSDGNVVGMHFAGPTWESNSGSEVVGTKLASAVVDPTAIPWLLLAAKSTSGHGIFADTTYIQRVDTAGGLAPSTPGTTDGQEADVPYTAQYFFYRADPSAAQ
jgi:uncharacterized protein DUF3455